MSRNERLAKQNAEKKKKCSRRNEENKHLFKPQVSNEIVS